MDKIIIAILVILLSPIAFAQMEYSEPGNSSDVFASAQPAKPSQPQSSPATMFASAQPMKSEEDDISNNYMPNINNNRYFNVIVTAKPNPVSPNGFTEINVMVSRDINVPVSNASVQLSAGGGSFDRCCYSAQDCGGIRPEKAGITDSSGSFIASWHPYKSTSGPIVYAINIKVANPGFREWDGTIDVTVEPPTTTPAAKTTSPMTIYPIIEPSESPEPIEPPESPESSTSELISGERQGNALGRSAEQCLLDGNKYFVQGKYDFAIACYNEAIRWKDPRGYFNRGNAYYNLKRYNEAIRDYRKALSMDPNLTQAQANLNVALKMAQSG